jgi:hypothetical protein
VASTFTTLSSLQLGRNGEEHCVLDMAHVAVECTTFSFLAQDKHQRCVDNHFMGTSPEAYEANIRLFHLIAFLYVMRHLNPQFIVTVRSARPHQTTNRCLVPHNLEKGGRVIRHAWQRHRHRSLSPAHKQRSGGRRSPAGSYSCQLS